MVLESSPDSYIPEPFGGHDDLNTEGELTIQWMTGEAAPNGVVVIIKGDSEQVKGG